MTDYSAKDLKLIYWLLICLFTIELAQIALKYFNDYYFNRIAIGGFNLLIVYFGYKIGINKIFVIGYGLISMILIVAAYFIIWN
ncbi:MAG TPA: hypothetical protein VGA21_08075 [Cyclobacteriaceae bacterium]|jgi:hypothetical protein